MGRGRYQRGAGPDALIAAIGASVGAVLGVLLSTLLTPSRGAQHSCPSGSTPDACSYPPKYTAWHLWWTLGGAFAGVLVIVLLARLARRRSR